VSYILPTYAIVFPQIRIEDSPAATRPTVGTVGATLGFQMAIGNQLFCELPLHPLLDRTRDITIGVSWAPVGSVAGNLVTWQLNSLALENGALINGAGVAHQAVDQPVPAVAFTYTRTGIVIPAAEIASTTDEFHLRISRVASSNDPAADPGIHHIAAIQLLTPSSRVIP
jgi:hypothetical protein